MSRPLRVDSPDTFHHVLSRGNDRRTVFTGRRDFERFVELLAQVAERFEIGIWSYVLMGNHYHLLLRTTRGNLSAAMQWLGVSDAAWFNAKHKRCGHLFQGRFKSFLVEEDDYLHRLILYVHRNPLRGGLVERLADYPWSSYRFLAYAAESPPWLRRRAVLALFDGNPARFRREIQDYSEEKDRLLENLSHGLILGSGAAIERLHRRTQEAPHAEKPQSKALARHIPIDKVVTSFQETFKVSDDALERWHVPIRGERRQKRDLLIYVLWRLGIASSRQIAARFGMTYTAIPHIRKRLQSELAHQPKVTRKIEKLISHFKM